MADLRGPLNVTLVLLLAPLAPVKGDDAGAKDCRITPERLGLPKGNTRTSEPFVVHIYKTDAIDQILKPQPSGYPFTIHQGYRLKENAKFMSA